MSPPAWSDPSKSEIIKTYPIGTGLDAFRSKHSSELSRVVLEEAESLSNKFLRNIALDLFLALQNLLATQHLPSSSGREILRVDILRFIPLAVSDDFDVNLVIPLLNAVGKNESDEKIWLEFYELATESTPPPRQLPSHLDQTPTSFNTASSVNTSENRKLFDGALRDELDSSLYIDVPGFFDTFFGEVANLTPVADAVFRKCEEGKDPLYNEEGGGWRDWPKDAKEEQVLKWLKELVDKLLEFSKLVKGMEPIPNVRRRLLGQPSLPLLGSATQRKLDVGFANDSVESARYDWSQILIPGELKSNPNADRHTSTWLDLARYARHVLTVQDTRRFVLGFTLCGSTMRLWEFDRLGGIASSPFDINTEGLQFVSAILGYLWMNNEQLGFDPTISEEDGRRYIKITRNRKPERLVIDQLIKRHSSVAGRATTCWKAHCEGDKSKQILVIKDSWQYPEREEEGELLREATKKGVVNVARYYHHETVQVGGSEDDVNGNIRKGLDITKASNALASKVDGKMFPPSTSGPPIGNLQRSRSRNAARKRSSSSLNPQLPSSKRTCSSSPHKQEASKARPNRVRRRVILRDYGKGIYKASSRVAMVAALEGNITGHESLRDLTGRIQSDISTGNLMMNEEEDNLSWSSFLIDLDLAIKEDRKKPSGAPNKTGTRAFMAIGALYGEKRTFMHDLESFFWALFWICIHYIGPNGKSRVVPEFDKWNYTDTVELARNKKGTVDHEGDFLKLASEHFTPYYQSLIPWANKLRRLVFPNGKRWEKDDPKLYSRMREILQEAMEDPAVKADWTG